LWGVQPSLWETRFPAVVTLYYFAYNFINIHRTLRVTPAMAAGVTDRLSEVLDLVAMLEASERGLERAGKISNRARNDVA